MNPSAENATASMVDAVAGAQLTRKILPRELGYAAQTMGHSCAQT